MELSRMGGCGRKQKGLGEGRGIWDWVGVLKVAEGGGGDSGVKIWVGAWQNGSLRGGQELDGIRGCV